MTEGFVWFLFLIQNRSHAQFSFPLSSSPGFQAFAKLWMRPEVITRGRELAP